MSHVTCYMSHVTCHMSHVICHNIFFYFIFFFRTKWWTLSMEGLLSTGPTPSSLVWWNTSVEETSKSDSYDGTIPQLDGQAEAKSSGLPPIEPIECEVKESDTKVEPCPFCTEAETATFCHCGKCEDCESMATQIGMNIHIINEHEPKLIWTHFGKDWVMKHKHWISGTYDPNWNRTWRDLNVLWFSLYLFNTFVGRERARKIKLCYYFVKNNLLYY